MFITRLLLGPSKQQKKIIQSEHKTFKNFIHIAIIDIWREFISLYVILAQFSHLIFGKCHSAACLVFLGIPFSPLNSLVHKIRRQSPSRSWIWQNMTPLSTNSSARISTIIWVIILITNVSVLKISMNASVKFALKMLCVQTQTDHFRVAVRQATKEMVSTVQVCDHFS